jgi:uncharacterized membrane protein
MKWFLFEWISGIGPAISIKSRSKKYSLCLCHHKPERSISFFGVERYLCARCLGICSGGIMGIIGLSLGMNPPLVLSILLMIPLVVDGFYQLFTDYESRNSTRLVTGFFFGIAVFFTMYDICSNVSWVGILIGENHPFINV